MKKYFLIAKNTWDEVLTYRLNFTMWRIRTVLSLLAIYFLWASILPSYQSSVFGYSQSQMLTYILGTALAFSIVLATRTIDIGDDINSGNLSAQLLRPISYFSYYFWKDIGDKAMNIFFSVIELTLLFFILHPPIFVQTSAVYISLAFASIILAVILNFLISSILGFIGFWSHEVWGPRFLFFTLLTFFSGTWFPLDIFPKGIYLVFQLLPFTYLLFFPLKIYLGQLNIFEILTGLSITVVWIFVFYVILKIVWNKGLKAYTAYGR